MDPDSFRSTLSNLAFSNVMEAAARDYQKELLAKEKAEASRTTNDEVDLDELMNDPELEKLHAERIAALKKDAEKREVLKRKGHGEYREITEDDFLGEVTGSDKVICHFYHHEFYRCKIMDKHLRALAPVHIDAKFIKLDAEVSLIFQNLMLTFTRSLVPYNLNVLYYVQKAPFFVKKLAIRTLPSVILLRNGIVSDRLIGFEDLGGKDDFTTRALEHLLRRKGTIGERKGEDMDEDGLGLDSGGSRSIRTSANFDSDSE